MKFKNFVTLTGIIDDKIALKSSFTPTGSEKLFFLLRQENQKKDAVNIVKFPITAWNQTATDIIKDYKANDLVEITGLISCSNYKDKITQKWIRRMDIICTKIQKIGVNGNNSEPAVTAQPEFDEAPF